MNKRDKDILLNLVRYKGDCKNDFFWIACKDCPFSKENISYTFKCAYHNYEYDVDHAITIEAKRLIYNEDPAALFDLEI